MKREDGWITVGRLTFAMGCQWFEWLPWRSFNWRNFDFVRLQIEWNPTFGNLEVNASLIGLTLDTTWNIRRPDETGKSIIGRVEKMREDIAGGCVWKCAPFKEQESPE